MNAHYDYDDYCREDMLATGLVNIAGHVTDGGDMSHLWETLRGVATVQDVMRIFRREGIRWGQLVEHDVVQVLSGHSPRYFLSKRKWAQIYRLRRGTPTPKQADWLKWLGLGDPGEEVAVLRRPGEGVEVLRLTIARWKQQREEHGVTTALIEHGYACYREQRYFYGTQEWKDKAKAVRFVAANKCWV